LTPEELLALSETIQGEADATPPCTGPEWIVRECLIKAAALLFTAAVWLSNTDIY
jgi:hypothetical protein